MNATLLNPLSVSIVDTSVNRQWKTKTKTKMESANDGKLPFLDVLEGKKTTYDSFLTLIYLMNIYTELLMNSFSFVPLSYKLGLIKALIERTFKINNITTNHNLHQVPVSSTPDKQSCKTVP